MKKYRIVEKNGKFYPQVRQGWWLFHYWKPINRFFGIDIYNIENATALIDRHAAKHSKAATQVIIHEYKPKQ
mgnify:CR=1 FL=1